MGERTIGQRVSALPLRNLYLTQYLAELYKDQPDLDRRDATAIATALLQDFHDTVMGLTSKDGFTPDA